MVIWLIGMSGVGKTTIGRELHKRLHEKMGPVVFLDGDHIREVFGDDLGHTIEDRRINAGRISRLCKFLDTQGLHIVCMVLSIFPDWQKWNRENFSYYFEVYVRAPFDALVRRDPKGLYRGALAGEIPDVVGVDIEFPEPPNSDLVIDNDFNRTSIRTYVEEILAKLPSGGHVECPGSSKEIVK